MQRSKQSSRTSRSVLSVHLVHLFSAHAMDMGSAGEGEEMHVLIHVRFPVLSHVRVPGLSLGHGLGPHVMAGRAILANLRGMVGTGGMGGLVSVEAMEGEADMAGIVERRGLVLHPAGVVDPHADDRRVTNAGYRRHRTRSSSCSVRSSWSWTRSYSRSRSRPPRSRSRTRSMFALPTRGIVGAGVTRSVSRK